MTIYWATVICFFVITSSDAQISGSSNTPLILPDPIIVRGLEWLENQREPDFGFQENTAKAVIAFQLANLSSWFTPDNLLGLLTVKQMDIEILLQLLRRHESPPSPIDIAFYCIALSSLCRDPKQFHGHDLISNINHQEMLLDMEFAVSSLAICTSGSHVRKRQIRRLLDITEQNKDVSVETLSMIVMALQCIVNDHRNRNLHHYLINPTKKLGKLQNEDGSFGNFKSSALAVQALEASDPDAHHWNKTKAISFLKKQQNPNGSFEEEDCCPSFWQHKDTSYDVKYHVTSAGASDHWKGQYLMIMAGGVVQATILAILALGPQGLVKVKAMNCHPDTSKDWFNPSMFSTPVLLNKTSDNNFMISKKNIALEEVKINNSSELNKPDENSEDVATVSYTLWVGSNVTETHTINITTDNNDTFYNVMQLAAQKDDHFSFLSTEWPNGHYVHTLAGYKEEPMSYHYWLLYKLPMPPDLSSPPPNQFVAPVGVDELLVEDGDHFLFWYKKL